jgi:hypothetical protein
LAVKAGEAATASLNQIDVLFRKAEVEPAIEPDHSDIRTAPSEAI